MQMTNSLIYLRRIGITNFRAYGQDFVLDLPDCPGVTLISGPNGLGKTTLFEATEWALTGSVERLLSLARNDVNAMELSLTSKREGVLAGSHSVSLAFSSGDRVVRSGTSIPQKDEIIRFLTEPSWNTPIHDVGSYLGLTHFVPQSQRVQFLQQDFGEQWEMLKLPAGAEELERLRLVLGNPGLTRAFNSSIDAASKAKAEMQKMREEFEALAKEVTELRNLAQAGASLPPDKLQQEIAPILKLLSLENISHEQASEPEALLAVVGESLAKAEARFKNLKLRLDPAKAILSQWTDLREKNAALVGRIEADEEHSTALQSTIPARQEEARKLRDAIEQIENNRNSIRNRIEQLSRLIESFVSREQISAEMIDVNERLTTIEARIASQISSQNELEHIRAEQHELLAQLGDARRSESLYLEKREFWTAYQAAADAANDAVKKRDSAVAETDILRKRGAILIEQENLCRSQIAALDAQLESSRQNAKAIDQAVSIIAARLTDADEECPVCKHHYPSAGELKQLATRSAALASADFPSIARAMAALREELRVLVDARCEVERETKHIGSIITSYEDIISDAVKKRAILESDLDLHGSALSAIPFFINERLQHLIKLQSNIEDKLKRFDSLDTIETRLNEISVSRAHFESDRLSVKRLQDELIRRSSQVESTILAHNDLLMEVANDLDHLRMEYEKSRQQVVQIEAGIASQKAQLEDHLRHEREDATMLSEFHKLNSEALAELGRLNSASDELLRQWIALDISKASTDYPSENLLASFQGQLREEETRIQDLKLKHQESLDGFNRWRNNQLLAAVEERMRNALAISNSKTVEEHRVWIANEEVGHDRQHSLAKRAKEVADQLKMKMLQEAEGYTSSILKPLNRRVSALHSMISPSYDFGFDFNVRQHKSRTDFGLQMNTVGGEVSFDPYLRLSEGQLSALNLTVLIAASTAYRWSRWRALLLDDPLQHNDLIHAAAFLDVVRSLVKEEGYQVIISTHDLESANFIERKCRGAAIPIQRCRLFSDSEDGVRYKAEKLYEDD